MEDEIEIISSGGEKEKCENLQKSAEKPSENLVNLEEGEKFSVRMNEKDVEIQKSPKSIDKAQSSQCIDLIDE